MPITRPSDDFKNKQNVNPVVNRINEATAEDFFEAGSILEEIANVLDIVYDEDYRAEFLGFFESLSLAASTFPNPPENSFVVLMENNQPTGIGKYISGSWQKISYQGSIVYHPQKTDFPETGQPNVWYVATEAEMIYLWYNGNYQPFGKPGQNGMSAYELAVQYGYTGTEEEWINNISGKAILYEPQTLTPEQKQQAQTNMGIDDFPDVLATYNNAKT